MTRMPGLNGFVKLHCSLLNWEWHDDPATLSVWIHLLLMANFVETEWHGVRLLPGQVVTGRAALAVKTGLSERQVRTALTRLKSSGCVSIKATNKYSIISLLNWKKFQLGDKNGDQQIDRKGDQRATNERPQRENVKNQRMWRRGGGLSIAFYRAFLNRQKEEHYGKYQKDTESSWRVGNVV